MCADIFAGLETKKVVVLGHIYSNQTLSGRAKRSYYAALSNYRKVSKSSTCQLGLRPRTKTNFNATLRQENFKKASNQTLSGGAKQSYYVALCNYRKVSDKHPYIAP